MKDFNEDAFFEAMMPLLQERRGADRCPDAETLIAVVHGTASATLQRGVAVHVARCSSCTHLRERLLLFDGPDLPESGTEWRGTKERLDLWLHDVLELERKGATVPTGALPQFQPDRWWKNPTQRLFSWRIGRALAATAAAGVLVGIYLVKPVAMTPPVQISARGTLPEQTPAHQNAESPTGNSGLDAAAQQSQGTGREVHSQPAPTETVAAPTEAGSPSPPVSVPTENGRPTTPAIITAVSPPRIPDGAGSPAVAQTPPLNSTELTVATAQVLPSAKDDTAMQSAAGVPPSALEASRRPEVPSLVQTNPPGATDSTMAPGRAPLQNNTARPGSVYRSSVGATPVSASAIKARSTAPKMSPVASAQTHAPGPPPPSVIRIDAGTRVWIRLKSINRTADGDFQFQGNLLLPVTQAGLVLLDRDTELHGLGRVNRERTSLRITELVSRGASYILKGEGGAMDTQSPGAGGALKFDSGHVYEMWIGSASTYEKIAGESGQPKR
jgi:hypothetical protein